MRLTRQTSHAIRILIHCARAPGELVKVAEIAERLDLTKHNVFKIVHLLTRTGFLEAVRGRYGGVRLARSPAEIRVGDVVRATEVTHVAIGDEDMPKRSSAGRAQPISSVFDNALEAFISVLDQHTLEEMARVQVSVPAEKPTRRKRPAARSRTATTGLQQGAGARR